MKPKNSKILAVDKQVRPTDVAIINGLESIEDKIDLIKVPDPVVTEKVVVVEKPTDNIAKLEEILEEVKKKEEVTDIQVSDEILEKLKGEPGKDYILTDEDKKEIAKKVKVPVVEKTEVIREIPIVKEVAVTETAEQIAEKINTLEKQIDFKVLKNVPTYAGKGGTKLISARSGGVDRYNQLKDVDMSGIADGDMPVWDETSKKWIPGTPTDTDEKVKLNASDPTAGYLDDKIGGYEFLTSTTGVANSFETTSKNLKSYPYAINYTGSQLTSIVYTLPAGTITKTLNYTGSLLTSIVLSGDTPSGINLTKTLGYSGSTLNSITYS